MTSLNGGKFTRNVKTINIDNLRHLEPFPAALSDLNFVFFEKPKILYWGDKRSLLQCNVSRKFSARQEHELS